MQKKAIALCLLVLFSIGMQAQKAEKVKRKIKTKEAAEKITFLNAGYMGQGITHPGLKIGIDYPLSAKLKRVEKYKRTGELRKTKVQKIEYFTGVNMGGFYHFKSETGLLLDLEVGRRMVRTNGRKRSFGLGTGTIQTFRNGPTFSTASNGTGFDQRSAAGQTGWQANFFVTYGKDNVFINSNSFNWELKYKLMAQFPFGTAIGLRNFVEFNIAFPFDLKQKRLIRK